MILQLEDYNRKREKEAKIEVTLQKSIWNRICVPVTSDWMQIYQTGIVTSSSSFACIVLFKKNS